MLAEFVPALKAVFGPQDPLLRRWSIPLLRHDWSIFLFGFFLGTTRLLYNDVSPFYLYIMCVCVCVSLCSCVFVRECVSVCAETCIPLSNYQPSHDRTKLDHDWGETSKVCVCVCVCVCVVCVVCVLHVHTRTPLFFLRWTRKGACYKLFFHGKAVAALNPKPQTPNPKPHAIRWRENEHMLCSAKNFLIYVYILI